MIITYAIEAVFYFFHHQEHRRELVALKDRDERHEWTWEVSRSLGKLGWSIVKIKDNDFRFSKRVGIKEKNKWAYEERTQQPRGVHRGSDWVPGTERLFLSFIFVTSFQQRDSSPTLAQTGQSQTEKE